MDQLTEKIKSELLKSGFPLEIYCHRLLLKHGWYPSTNQYLVQEDGLQKEVDITARKQFDIDPKVGIFFTSHISCKKNSSNHWVFFEDDKKSYDLAIDTCFINKIDLNISQIRSRNKLHIDDYSIPRSVLYTMAFQSGQNQIYDSFKQCLTSIGFFKEFYGKHRKTKKPMFDIIDVDFLTTVFDGKLFLGKLIKDEEIHLTEVNHIIYNYHKVQYPHHQYFSIEVVTKDYFEKYLTLLDKDVDYILSDFTKQLSKK